MYGGDVYPLECWSALQKQDAGTAVLIDVRTQAEWAYVGVPMLEASMMPVVLQEWQSFPHMNVNPSFGDVLNAELEKAGVDKNASLYFLCRSGVRSLAAAKVMAAMGYKDSFNVSHGFEGDPDENGHRGRHNGWKADNLPWRQG